VDAEPIELSDELSGDGVQRLRTKAGNASKPRPVGFALDGKQNANGF
jgi:hypothetical protein